MSVRRSLAWAFSGQFAALVVGFLGSIVVARLLSPREMGVYAIAMAAQGIVGIFVNFGVGAYVVRDPDLRPETLDAAFTVNALLAVGLSVILFALSFAGGWLLGAPEAGRVLRVSALGPLIGVAGFRPSAMLQREMRFKATSLIDTGGVLLTALGTVAFALAGQSYMSPAYSGLLSGVACVLAYSVVGRRHHGFRLSLAGWRPITTFGVRMVSVSGVAVLAMRLSDLVLGRVVGTAALGLYGRASGLSNLIFTNIYGTATRVVFVQLSRDYRETGELKTTFLRGLQLITAFMWPLLAGLAVLARPMIYILYGEKWLAAATPLSLLLIAQFLALCFGMNWELFVLRDETARQTRFEVIRSVVALGIFSLGCLVSLTAAAAGRIAESAIGLLLYYPHVRRLAQTDRGEIPAVFAQSAMLTVAAVAPALLLMIGMGWSERAPAAALAGVVGLGVALWTAVLFALRHPLSDEIILAWRRVAGRPPVAVR